MQSKAKTVKEYIASLPVERRKEVEATRKLVLKNLPKGYEEVVQYGMLGYVIPLKTYPDGYLGRNTEPVPYVCLASQKNYISLYLMSIYSTPAVAKAFEKEYKESGKKMNVGKSCVRFKKYSDLPEQVIAKAISSTSVKEHLKNYLKVKGK